MSKDEKTKSFIDLMRAKPQRPHGAGTVAPTGDQGKTAQAGSPAPSPADTSSQNVAEFVAQMKSATPKTSGSRGRLMFAMDATMSRQPTWDMALQLQAQMFDAVADVGGLDVQLVYFRGAGECRHSSWVSDATALARLMTQVGCRGGRTQIGKVVTHAREEAAQKRVDAVVLVGDAFEEDIDEVCATAGELALLGVPMFVFQEGHNRQAETALREIARLTNGAWCRFDAGAAAQLRELLTAVAVYAAGGRSALEDLSKVQGSGLGAQRLLQQLKK